MRDLGAPSTQPRRAGDVVPFDEGSAPVGGVERRPEEGMDLPHLPVPQLLDLAHLPRLAAVASVVAGRFGNTDIPGADVPADLYGRQARKAAPHGQELLRAGEPLSRLEVRLGEVLVQLLAGRIEVGLLECRPETLDRPAVLPVAHRSPPAGGYRHGSARRAADGHTSSGTDRRGWIVISALPNVRPNGRGRIWEEELSQSYSVWGWHWPWSRQRTRSSTASSTTTCIPMSGRWSPTGRSRSASSTSTTSSAQAR